MMDDIESLGYLARLMLRLTIGAASLTAPVQEAHANYVLSRQRSDGGWAGREGESDLYYTSFALRSLAMLGHLEGKLAEDSAAFLRSRLTHHESIVDLLSLVYSAKLIEAACGLDPLADQPEHWKVRLAELLDSLRRDDGGYAKSSEGRAGSTYQTFLVLLCLELIEQPIPERDKAAQFLLGQQQSDGGFLEIRVAKRSGTNPTAAAIGGLRVLGKLDDKIASDAVDFLLDLQGDEGGLQANTRIPMPDLLSTFTGCVTLADLEHLHELDTQHALQYVQSMQQTGGGFRGFAFDPADDVEYTFYGLGALALLGSV